MKVVFLGTSSSFPTKDRSHPALLVRYGPEAILFDCGEGTQRQLRIAGESPMKITKIFISHWHGDHVLGLPGLLQSMAMNKRFKAIDIYGPKGTIKHFGHLMEGFAVKNKFNMKIHEVSATKKPAIVCEEEEYVVRAVKLKHPITCLGYAFEVKTKYNIKKDFVKKHNLQGSPLLDKLQAGKDIKYKGKTYKVKDVTKPKSGPKVAIVLDTESTPEIAALAKDADVFVCEGTFSNKIKDKAHEKGHLSVKDAAKLAKKAKAKELWLTHFSQRYKDISELEKEAKSVFKKTKMARDFASVSISSVGK